MSSNTDSDSDNDSETETKTDFFFSRNREEKYEVISEGEEGFDKVVRPDYKSAKSAAEVHESATGNFCMIEEVSERRS